MTSQQTTDTIVLVFIMVVVEHWSLLGRVDLVWRCQSLHVCVCVVNDRSTAVIARSLLHTITAVDTVLTMSWAASTLTLMSFLILICQHCLSAEQPESVGLCDM